jgi:hypothetical protein
MAFFVLQALSLATGLVLIYAAAFLYEDEERRVQDTLALWWIRLHELEGGMLPKASALLAKSNEIVSSFMARLLGPKIVSIHFVAVSMVLSFAAGPLVFGIGTLVLEITSLRNALVALGLVLLGAVLTWRALMPLKTGRAPVRLAMSLSLLLSLSALFRWDDRPEVRSLFVLIAFLSIASDAVVTVLLRKLLESIGARSPVIFALIAPPSVYAAVAAMSFMSIFVLGPFSWVLLLVSNLPSLFFVSLVLLMPFVLIVGRPILTLLDRGVYTLQRNNVVQNKKLLWTLAALCLSAVPFLGPGIEQIKRLLK